MHLVSGTWLDNYSHRLPSNLTSQAWISFGFGLVVTGVIAGPIAAVASGVLSALATLIHTIVSPLFAMYGNTLPSTASCMMRTSIAVCLTFFTGSILNLPVDIIRSLFVNLAFDAGYAIAQQSLPGNSTRFFWIVNF